MENKDCRNHDHEHTHNSDHNHEHTCNHEHAYNIAGEISEQSMYDLGELFKVFGDYTRLRILFVLFEKEMAVGDMAEELSMTQSAISHQLSVLKKAKLVIGRRDGKSIIYSLADDHVRSIIAQGMEHVLE